MESNEFDNQMSHLLGNDWKERDETICKTAQKVRICLRNKVFAKFLTAWIPENGDYVQEHQISLKAYCTGWRLVMNELISDRIKNQGLP